VLDPFAGSGTTGVVSCKNNRKFIGIELVDKYQKMAQARINETLIQPSIFEMVR
jgi:site-specific DNA-methyltransferase (adenine-specific)